MANWLQEFQAHYRAVRQGQIDEAIFESTGKNILKAASAMLEANVEREKVKELLINYRNLRPSDVDFFLDKVEHAQNLTFKILTSYKKELTDRLKSVSSFYESWNQCCQTVAIGNLNKPRTRITTGFKGSLKSFPLDCGWGFRCNIVDDAVDISHFVHDTV